MEAPAGQPEGAAKYHERLRENVEWLAEDINGITLRRAAGMADLAYTTVWNWLHGEAEPTMGRLGKLAEVLGVEAGDLLMDHEELQQRVEERGLRPFVLRPVTTNHPSSEASGAGRKARKHPCHLVSLPPTGTDG